MFEATHFDWLKLRARFSSTPKFVMVTRKRTKQGVRKEPSPKLKTFLKEGDWLDVMDGDGVWNVAQVLSVPSPGEVEITYDGWPAEYDEVVRVDSDRVAPYHTFTWAVKCWVKYLNWPLWPSLVTVRTPGTQAGIKNLAAENRLYIDFLDNPNFAKRDRCWQMKRQVRAFDNDYDKKRTGSTGDEFEQALGWVLQADAPTKLPKFAGGTLPENYAHTTTASVQEVRIQMGDELWFQNFTNNRMRHQLAHVYNTNGEEEEHSSDESSSATMGVEKRTLNLSAGKRESQSLPNEKKRPPPVKIEQESSADVEVPYELELLDSSDASVSKEDQGSMRTKRRRLRTNPRKGRARENRRSQPTFITTHVPVSRRKGHGKGQIKMAARRSFPPVGEILNPTAGDIQVANYSPDEDHDGEYEAVNSVQSALQTDTTLKHVINHRTEKLSESEAEQDAEVNSTASKSPQYSRGSIEREITLTTKKLQTLEEEKQQATEDTFARREGIRLGDSSPMSADSHGRAQPIAPHVDMVETHRSKQASSAFSKHSREVDEVLDPQPMSKMNKRHTGIIIPASDNVGLRSEKLGSSVLSEDRAHSSDRNESKGTSCVEQTGSKSRKTVKITAEPPSQQKVSSADEETQEQRRPFCVMHAQKEDAQLADTQEKVKISMKTAISASRKFDEKSIAKAMLAQRKGPSLSDRSSSPRQSVVLTKGDWLDVMDQDGVWNVARVLSVPSPEEVEVMYDGWPEEYDEVVRVDSDRVAPFHTFTWAVKCWVKYLNWPMWPSVITIRTPGTAEGIKNLAMENQLYVDFLDNPNFAKRDRCWQKKRQVKFFYDNYDRNRMGTNGAQFERALEFVLRSDATTKMPKFARGTLPLQYDNLTTESVERMRKNMGNGLWYRNFANNKARHMHTHIYEEIGDEEETASDESAPLPKLKVRRTKTSESIDDRSAANTQKKKKRPLPFKPHDVPVKIEPESLAEIEVTYELESMDSSESDREKDADLAKKRRLPAKTRSTIPPVSGLKKSKRAVSPQDSNVASTMPRHVTVMMDEIIVDDDQDSDCSGVIQRQALKKTGHPPARKNSVDSIPARLKKERGNSLSLSESEALPRKPMPKSARMHQCVRRRKPELAVNLHGGAWNESFSMVAKSATLRSKRQALYVPSDDENDDSECSDSFDPGTTSEDKAGSPFDSHQSSQEKAAASLVDTARPTRHARLKTETGYLDSTTIKARDKVNTKMAARRSIPHLGEDLSLAASAKPRQARSERALSDDNDWEDEEKGVPKAPKPLVRKEFAAKKLNARRRNQQFEKLPHNGPAAISMMPREQKSPKRSKTTVSLIEQRIASAHEALRLDKEKAQEIQDTSAPDRRDRANGAVPETRVRPRSSMLRAEIKEPPLYQRKRSDVSVLRVAGRGHGSSMVSDVDGGRQGQALKTPLDLELKSDQQGHSFLAVDKAYSSDSQESKSVPTPFDVDIRGDPTESPRVNKADAKVLPKVKVFVDSKQAAEEKAASSDCQEGESPEVGRHFCVMRAGLEDVLEVDGDENIETSKKTTMISVPQKFGELSQEAGSMLPPRADLCEVFQMYPSSTVFSSSNGFSMEKWFKSSLVTSFRGTKT
ncbi:hypothetical protein PRNP1_000906 [Phytophthora ramorum]